MMKKADFSVAELFSLPEGDVENVVLQELDIPDFEVVSEISKRLGLTFIPEKEAGNLCFAYNSEDLRAEYRQSFFTVDLVDYLYAVLYASKDGESDLESLPITLQRIPYPTDTAVFWECVQLGAEVRRTFGRT